MIRGAEGITSPTPRADVELARECRPCLGWGTVVTDEGRHELCPDCQDDRIDRIDRITAPERVRAVRLRPGSRYVSPR
ncbi:MULTISPECIES: hypothetical protein [unclassified Streptomyces]|uniref:hypothetical protein n=1 Tax=unclassified Streptomyces TaxID=2593676 RepID=UPI000380CEC2|nr:MULTISPECIES: hypothetical protein [unclassified Streptomyces]MYX33398.1 hypothetical protein [Streptomyces sp. SID8377]